MCRLLWTGSLVSLRSHGSTAELVDKGGETYTPQNSVQSQTKYPPICYDIC